VPPCFRRGVGYKGPRTEARGVTVAPRHGGPATGTSACPEVWPMSIPASLLQSAEAHPCFSGCYGSDPDVSVCLDPARPLAPLLVASCHDCFARLGVPRALLPSGATANWLSGQLTQHLRKQRGFALSFSGYHTKGPGFWLSVAYYATCGLFLINGERSRALGSDL